MATKQFHKEDLLECLWDDDADLLKVEDEIIDQSRWSIIHRLVFTEVGTHNFYEVTYSHGATEYQDETPFEYEPNMIECHEVEPVEITKTVYQRIE